MLRRLIALAVVAAGTLAAGITRIYVVDRSDVLDGSPMGKAGPYERIVAKAHFAVDPALPANQIISDIVLAPRLAHLGLMDFDHAAEAMAAGMDCVRRHLPLLRDVLDLPEAGG